MFVVHPTVLACLLALFPSFGQWHQSAGKTSQDRKIALPLLKLALLDFGARHMSHEGSDRLEAFSTFGTLPTGAVDVGMEQMVRYLLRPCKSRPTGWIGASVKMDIVSIENIDVKIWNRKFSREVNLLRRQG